MYDELQVELVVNYQEEGSARNSVEGNLRRSQLLSSTTRNG
jgi:hypothetical protein